MCLEKNAVRSKNWIFHVKSILAREKDSLVAQIIMAYTKEDVRQRFLTPPDHSSFNADGSVPKIVAHHVCEQLKSYVKEEQPKEVFMDDLSELKNIEKVIENLEAELLQVAHYSDIYWETLPEHNKAHAVANVVGKEKKLVKLGLILLESAKFNDCDALGHYLQTKFPINFQHPVTNFTALHTAMASNSIEYGAKLISTGECDYLLRSTRGNLAYDLAYDSLKDLDLADRLEELTTAQARMQGLNLDNLYKHQQPENSDYTPF